MKILDTEMRVFDADTHVEEPADLWLTRLPARYADRAPTVHWQESARADWWFMGGRPIRQHISSHMGWGSHPPDFPPTWQDVNPVTYDVTARLKYMDETGISTQVLFPNLAMFAGANLVEKEERQFQNLLITTFNDWQAEWSSPAPERLLPMTSLPFWDLDASLREFERCADMLGFKGVTVSQDPTGYGLPRLSDRHWDPLWAAFQERGTPVNFHIGTGNTDLDFNPGTSKMGLHASFALLGIPIVAGNIMTVVELIFGGVCHRFPNLKFVAVESGAGYWPSLLELMDWQFLSCGVHKEHPEYELLPSEYFKRQIYGCFWFERDSLLKAVEQIGADNFLFETDFPHPTSQTPGPASPAVGAAEYIRTTLSGLPMADIHKLLHGNAEKIYGLNGASGG